MRADQVSVAQAFELVGAQAFPDWCPIERYRELEQERAAKSSLPRFLTGTTPVFAPPPSTYDKAKDQFDAVALWLSSHGFLPDSDAYDLASLQQAIADNPLKSSNKSKGPRPTDGRVKQYVQDFIAESKNKGSLPSQIALLNKAKSENFRAQRTRLFAELAAQGYRLERSRPSKSPN